MAQGWVAGKGVSLLGFYAESLKQFRAAVV
jgi:hypothetical protein